MVSIQLNPLTLFTSAQTRRPRERLMLYRELPWHLFSLLLTHSTSFLLLPFSPSPFNSRPSRVLPLHSLVKYARACLLYSTFFFPFTVLPVIFNFKHAHFLRGFRIDRISQKLLVMLHNIIKDCTTSTSRSAIAFSTRNVCHILRSGKTDISASDRFTNVQASKDTRWQ